MPNITWQEPQILADILALSLYAAANGQPCPNDRIVALISPWLSNIEITLRPGPWYQLLTMGVSDDNPSLLGCVRSFRKLNWTVRIGVLRYGVDQEISKPPAAFDYERRWLRQALDDGAEVYLVPNLHAKGIVTPFGIVTGSTNLTHSGVYVQSQNANYFSCAHLEYLGNRQQLLAFLRPEYRAAQDDLR
jgi:hypothetical protein